MILDCFALAGLIHWVLEATFIPLGNTLPLFLMSEVDRVGGVTVHAPFPRCSHSPVVSLQFCS